MAKLFQKPLDHFNKEASLAKQPPAYLVRAHVSVAIKQSGLLRPSGLQLTDALPNGIAPWCRGRGYCAAQISGALPRIQRLLFAMVSTHSYVGIYVGINTYH